MNEYSCYGIGVIWFHLKDKINGYMIIVRERIVITYLIDFKWFYKQTMAHLRYTVVLKFVSFLPRIWNQNLEQIYLQGKFMSYFLLNKDRWNNLFLKSLFFWDKNPFTEKRGGHQCFEEKSDNYLYRNLYKLDLCKVVNQSCNLFLTFHILLWSFTSLGTQ